MQTHYRWSFDPAQSYSRNARRKLLVVRSTSWLNNSGNMTLQVILETEAPDNGQGVTCVVDAKTVRD